MIKKTKVAKKSKVKNREWDWTHSKYRKRYARRSGGSQNWVEENGILYLIEADEDRLLSSLDGALKICGSIYALVLVMTDGDNQSQEFNQHHANIQQKNFRKHGVFYVKQFEKIIKNFGLYVGLIKDHDKIDWIKGETVDYDITISAIRDIYFNNKSKFYRINNRLYYLRPIRVVVEEMYFMANAVAGGDFALAIALSSDEKTKQTHYRNFQRMGFKQGRTFYRYANLFANYLSKNQSLPLLGGNYDKTA